MTRLTNNGKSLQFGGKTVSMPPAYDDWFLPSRDELSTMKNNVETEAGLAFGIYWASTESNANDAIFLSSGSGSGNPKTNVYKVRPCRQFNAPIGTYSIKDQGPAGGWIFFTNDTLYMEAAPNDLDASIWSNISNSLVGGTGLVIGDGITNTQLIINQVGHISSAAKLCDDLVVFGSL